MEPRHPGTVAVLWANSDSHPVAARFIATEFTR
jgi:hypothetical protein